MKSQNRADAARLVLALGILALLASFDENPAQRGVPAARTAAAVSR